MNRCDMQCCLWLWAVLLMLSYIWCVCVANLLLLLFDQKAAGRKHWTEHAVGKGLSLYLRGCSLYLKGLVYT